MGEIDGEARVSESPNFASGNVVFDASQYGFFGKDVMEEVELGGLEDDCDNGSLVNIDVKDCQSFPNKNSKEGVVGLLSDIDDLSSTFSKLNRTVSEPQSIRKIRGRGSFSRESSLAADWAQEPDVSNWIDQHLINIENAHGAKQWPSHPYPFPIEPKPLYRTSSYPQQPHPYQQPSTASEPIVIPKSSFPSHPPQVGLPIPFSAPNLTHFSPPHNFPARLPHGLQFMGEENVAQFGPLGISVNTRQPNPNHWPNQAGLLPGLHNSNGLMHHRLHQVQQPSPPHFANLQPRLYGPQTLQMLGMRPLQGPQFRSKYMSSEEIDNIMRIQHAATHSNDPYVDDYYHQACLAKKSLISNSRMRHHFCPISIPDSPSKTRANSEPHAYLQVDALGRLPFSSIRRPRPLLEVDSHDETLNKKSSIKPIEHEPMLAARITIEGGLCLLLDVDDIDRVLQFNSPQDGGAQLWRKRQSLLEELAASLHLVDPLGPGIIAPKDDLVFLRIVSLPKGRKLFSCYLKLLHPSDDLARIVSMAVFRHLRFLFDEMPLGSTASKTTRDLMIAVSSIVCGMSLGALSACLAAVVCSSEQPPLRPIGSSAGDGASIVVKSLLDRATELLSDRHTASANYSIRNLWQESFNAFFALLTKYCISKYEGIANAAPITESEVAKAISHELPIELLKASLPHTDEKQRKFLLEFAQRSMPIASHTANGSS